MKLSELFFEDKTTTQFKNPNRRSDGPDMLDVMIPARRELGSDWKYDTNQSPTVNFSDWFRLKRKDGDWDYSESESWKIFSQEYGHFFEGQITEGEERKIIHQAAVEKLVNMFSGRVQDMESMEELHDRIYRALEYLDVSDVVDPDMEHGGQRMGDFASGRVIDIVDSGSVMDEVTNSLDLSDLQDKDPAFPYQYKEEVEENLRAWFGKGKKGGAGGGGWDRYNTKGERIGKCGDSKKGEGKPKCLSKSRAASLRAKGGKKAIAAAVRKKRREDPNKNRKGKAKNVSNTTRKSKKK